MKCFYHRNDLDGVCSGAIVKLKYPECETIPVDYIDELEDVITTVKEDEEVFIVDFSFPLEMMKSLILKTKNIVWIDHHISSIEKLREFEGLPGIRLDGVSGCELTYFYLNKIGSVKVGEPLLQKTL